MRKMSRLEWLCCLVYFTSYVTRINYAACLAEIVVDLDITKQAASIAVTGAFISYGLGQIISGVIGDRFSPRKIIASGLIATSLINLGMVLLPNIQLMTAFWFFNGFFQALIWPPMMRLMVENMDEKGYAHAVFTVTASASIATIFIYIMVPFAIEISGWRLAFLLSAAIGLIVTSVWLIGTVGVKTNTPQKTGSTAPSVEVQQRTNASLLLWLAPVLIAIILQGTLRDGITTWMPTYISEVFHLETSVSILTSAILPVFSILSLRATTWLNNRIRNEMTTACTLFGVGCLCAVLLNISFSKNVTLEVIWIALLAGSMHGVNLMLVGQVPAFFSKYGKVSTISGIMNACTYIGSALSTYGFAVLSDIYGWAFTILGWCMIALAGTLLTLFFIKPWTAFRRN